MGAFGSVFATKLFGDPIDGPQLYVGRGLLSFTRHFLYKGPLILPGTPFDRFVRGRIGLLDLFLEFWGLGA